MIAPWITQTGVCYAPSPCGLPGPNGCTWCCPPGPATEARSLTEGEWIIRLGECYGELCAEHRQGAGAGDTALDALIRTASQWRSERAS